MALVFRVGASVGARLDGLVRRIPGATRNQVAGTAVRIGLDLLEDRIAQVPSTTQPNTPTNTQQTTTNNPTKTLKSRSPKTEEAGQAQPPGGALMSVLKRSYCLIDDARIQKLDEGKPRSPRTPARTRNRPRLDPLRRRHFRYTCRGTTLILDDGSGAGTAQ